MTALTRLVICAGALSLTACSQDLSDLQTFIAQT